MRGSMKKEGNVADFDAKTRSGDGMGSAGASSASRISHYRVNSID